MPVIKGGLKIGKRMSVEDKEKVREHFPRFVAPKGEEAASDWKAVKAADSKVVVPDLEKMKKDELNDWAAKHGLGSEVKESMKKKDIISRIKRFFGVE